MELEDIYETIENDDVKDTCGPQISSDNQGEGKAQKQRGRVCLVLMMVSLGLICVHLLVFIIWLNISITAERDLVKRYETTVQEFNHTINSLQTNYTDLRTDKDKLKKSLDSLNQTNQELQNKITSLNEKIKKAIVWDSDGFFISEEEKTWFDSRQFCRDHGGDLVMIKTEEKQRLVSSKIKKSVWIGLSDTETEGRMTWVDNSPLIQGFFFPHEPNDAHGNEDCVETQASSLFTLPNTWNDLSCTDLKRWMCEK